MSLAYSPDSDWLAVGTVKGRTRLLSMDNDPAHDFALPDQGRGISAMTFSERGEWLITGTGNYRVSRRARDPRYPAETTESDDVIERHGDSFVRGWHITQSPKSARWEVPVQDDQIVKIGLNRNGWVLVGSYSGWDRVERRSLLKQPALSAHAFKMSEDSEPNDLSTPRTTEVAASRTVASMELVQERDIAVVGQKDGGLTLVNLTVSNQQSQPVRQELRAHVDAVTVCAVLGELVVTGSLDGTLRLWDLAGTAYLSGPLRLQSPASKVYEIDTEESEQWLAARSASFGGQVQLWQLKPSISPTPLMTLPGFHMRFAPDGRYLLVGQTDRVVLVRLDESPPKVFSLSGVLLATSLNGQHLLTGGLGHESSVWDLWSKDVVASQRSLAGGNGTRRAVFADDENDVFTLGDDGVGRFWRLSTDKVQRYVAFGAFSIPDFTDSRVVALDSHQLITDEDVPNKLGVARNTAAPSPTRSLVMRRFEFSNGTVRQSSPLNSMENILIADSELSPNGEWLALGIWKRGQDVRKESLVFPRLLSLVSRSPSDPTVLSGPTDLASALHYSSDNRMLAIGSRDGSLHLWTLQQPPSSSRIFDHIGPINDIQFNSDSSLLATAGEDGKARLWHTNQLDLGALEFDSHTGPLSVVQFSKDSLDLPPKMRQAVKRQNPWNGENESWDCLAGGLLGSSN